MKSAPLSQCKILIFLLAHIFACAAGAAPDAKTLGDILGYPEDDLTVQDITDEERNLWIIPTAKERNRSASLVDPKTLVAAYKVTGRVPATFFPMRIWIGEKGTFLNSESRQILDTIATAPDGPVTKGGKGPFGPQSFDALGEGGIYLGRIKVPSAIKEMQEPQDKAAIISVMHLPSEGVDVKIAIMAALEGPTELVPVAGGEKYYEAFRPSMDGESGPRYDVAGLFRSLNQLASAESHTTAKPSQITPADQIQHPPSTSIETGHEEANASNDDARPEKQKSAYWVWIAFAVFIVAAILFYKIRR